MPAAIAPAPGAASEPASATHPDGGEAARDGEDRQHDGPRAGDARREQRHARVAGGRQVAEDSGLDVLRADVAPTMVPMMRAAARLMTSMSSLKLPSPPAARTCRGCRRAGWP